MTNFTRGLLSDSLKQYKEQPEKQLIFIAHVKQQLIVGEKGEQAIGFSFSDDYIKAGKMFLRILTLYKL